MWVSINDDLPKLGLPVFVTDGKDILVCQRVTSDDELSLGWKWEPCGIGGYEWEWIFDPWWNDGEDPITHWMHTPSLPGEDKP